MPATLVQSVSVGQASASGLTATFENPSTFKNFLCAWVALVERGTDVTLANFAGWTVVGPWEAPAHGSPSIYFLYRENSASVLSFSPTWNGPIDGVIHMYEWAGLPVSGVVDKSTGDFDNAGSLAPDSGLTATLVQADELVMGCVANRNSSTTHNAPFTAGFTARLNTTTISGAQANSINVTSRDKIVAAIGQQKFNCALSASRAWAAAVVALKIQPFATVTKTSSLNAVLARQNLRTASMSALLQKAGACTAAFNAAIARQGLASIGTDAQLIRRILKTMSINALLLKTVNKQFSFDAQIDMPGRRLVSLSGVLQKRFAQAFMFDARIQKQLVTKAAGMNAVLSRDTRKLIAMNAAMLKRSERRLTMDCLIDVAWQPIPKPTSSWQRLD